jgi:predicted nucleic acid-binding protein
VRRYLLDTAPLAALLHARPVAVSLITLWMQQHEASTSILAYGEVIEYLRGSPRYAQHRRALRTLFREIYPHLLTYRIVERYADLRRQLRPPHGAGLIGDVDTLIAATALEHDLTVVTTDEDFQRVPGIKVLLLDRRKLATR